MENINGDSGPTVGMESANSSGQATDSASIGVDPLDFAETCIERAQDRLSYGRRQEAEEALKLLSEARFGIAAARASREGQRSSEGVHGEDSSQEEVILYETKRN